MTHRRKGHANWIARQQVWTRPRAHGLACVRAAKERVCLKEGGAGGLGRGGAHAHVVGVHDFVVVWVVQVVLHVLDHLGSLLEEGAGFAEGAGLFSIFSGELEWLTMGARGRGCVRVKYPNCAALFCVKRKRESYQEKIEERKKRRNIK